jgi:hypothetical protein
LALSFKIKKNENAAYTVLCVGRSVAHRPRLSIADRIEAIVHTTQTTVLILTSRVNANLFVKIHEIPTINPPIANDIITTITAVNATLTTIGKLTPLGSNSVAIAPTKEVIDIPIK